MNNSIHTESTFESAIIGYLTSNCWYEGDTGLFDAAIALDREAVISFIKNSQPKEWEQLKTYYREDSETKFIQRLVKELDLRGMLDVVRHGITDSGIKFRLAYFKPASKLNPDTLRQYNCNVIGWT